MVRASRIISAGWAAVRALKASRSNRHRVLSRTAVTVAARGALHDADLADDLAAGDLADERTAREARRRPLTTR